MPSLNSVIIIGRLGRDSQPFNGGCSLAVAVSEVRKDKEGKKKERTDWFRVVLWGKTADFATKHLKKGAEVLVSGSLRTGDYTKDGVKHYNVDIYGNNLQVIKWPEDKKPDAVAKARQEQAELPTAMADADDIPF